MTPSSRGKEGEVRLIGDQGRYRRGERVTPGLEDAVLEGTGVTGTSRAPLEPGPLYRKGRRALGTALGTTCATRGPTSPHQPQSRYLELSPFGNRRLRGVQVTRARPRPTHRAARAPRASACSCPDVRPAPSAAPPGGVRAGRPYAPSRALGEASPRCLKVPCAVLSPLRRAARAGDYQPGLRREAGPGDNSWKHGGQRVGGATSGIQVGDPPRPPEGPGSSGGSARRLWQRGRAKGKGQLPGWRAPRWGHGRAGGTRAAEAGGGGGRGGGGLLHDRPGQVCPGPARGVRLAGRGACALPCGGAGAVQVNGAGFWCQLRVPPARRVPDGLQEVGLVCQVRVHCGQGAVNALMVLEAPPKCSS